MDYIVERDGRLISIRVPEGATDDTLDSDSLYRQVEAELGSGAASKYLLLHDLERTPRSSVRRKVFVSWVRAHRDLIVRRIEAYAVVAPNTIQRGMITAVLWVLEPPITHRVFANAAEARAWLDQIARGDA